MSNDILVEQAQSQADFEAAAWIYTNNDPWKAMGRGFEHNLAKVTHEDTVLYVARCGEQVVGACLLEEFGQLAPYIRALCVDDGWRNKRIGEKLVEAALERAYESHDYLFLTTSTDDALRFYKRLGFDEVGYITDMHAPGNNEHLLRKMKR